MSRPTAEDQYKFLLSCVRNSNNGKVDFVSVSHELGITSRGAAAKRYGRLLRLHGVKCDGERGQQAEDVAANNKTSRASIARAAEAKRRKIECQNNDPLADDGYAGQVVKREPRIKMERSSFSFACSSWGTPLAATQTPGYRYSSGVTGYGVSMDTKMPYIKLEDEVDSVWKPPAKFSSRAGQEANDERIFEDFCTSELFDCDQNESSSNSNAATADRAPAQSCFQPVCSPICGPPAPTSSTCSGSSHGAIGILL